MNIFCKADCCLPVLAFAFGPFRLIPSKRLLIWENQPVKLGGRAIDILHLLVMRAGEEISKKALIEWTWPNVFVDERNLKVHVNRLRHALQDNFPEAIYIATVVGRGYQFVAPVQTEHITGFSPIVRREPPAHNEASRL